MTDHPAAPSVSETAEARTFEQEKAAYIRCGEQFAATQTHLADCPRWKPIPVSETAEASQPTRFTIHDEISGEHWDLRVDPAHPNSTRMDMHMGGIIAGMSRKNPEMLSVLRKAFWDSETPTECTHLWKWNARTDLWDCQRCPATREEVDTLTRGPAEATSAPSGDLEQIIGTCRYYAQIEFRRGAEPGTFWGAVLALCDRSAALLAAERRNEELTTALRKVADFCDTECRVPHTAPYTAQQSLEDARNLALAALAGARPGEETPKSAGETPERASE